MKEWILDFLDAHLGKILLLVALGWAGWCIYANRYTPMPSELTSPAPRQVYVVLDAAVIAQSGDEKYFAEGPAANYAKLPNVMAQEVKIRKYVPIDLDVPPLTVKRPAQILPEPGPSLEGSDKLPRFGEEFTPPSAKDLAPPAAPVTPKGLGAMPAGGNVGGAAGAGGK
jgi:hypothetical protein